MNRVVGVRFINNGPYGNGNCTNIYWYKDPIGVNIGDDVVVETRYGLAVARVVEADTFCGTPTCNVVSTIDSPYYRECRRIENIQRTKKELDSLIRNCTTDQIIDMLTGRNEELRKRVCSLDKKIR